MRGFRADNLRSKRTASKAAALVVNGVTNATLTVTAATAGYAGNDIRIAIVTGAPSLNVSLAAAIASNLITVTLGTDGSGVLDDTKNTGTLVAAAVDALTEVICTTSGSGAGIVAPVAVQSLKGGHDIWSISGLAKAANVSDQLIKGLENGGNCDIQVGQRLADALGETLATLGSMLG